MENKKTIFIASKLGYKGDSNKEAKNWILAVDKGLDMSDDARFKRASDMGFKTDCVYYHGTGSDFDTFDKNKIGKNYTYSENSGFFFTQKKRSAEGYAFIHSNGEGGRVIQAFLKFSNPYKASTNSDYHNPADQFDISGHDMMHDVRMYGNDCILIKGTHNDDLCVVFEPNQILSIYAAFDPETEIYKNDKEKMQEFFANKVSCFYIDDEISDEIKDFIGVNFKNKTMSSSDDLLVCANELINKFPLEEINVIHGKFDYKDHTWITINNKKFDPNLSQFDPDLDMSDFKYFSQKIEKIIPNMDLSGKRFYHGTSRKNWNKEGKDNYLFLTTSINHAKYHSTDKAINKEDEIIIEVNSNQLDGLRFEADDDLGNNPEYKDWQDSYKAQGSFVVVGNNIPTENFKIINVKNKKLIKP